MRLLSTKIKHVKVPNRDEYFESASIILTPPDRTVLKGDSGDEEGGDVNNLSGRQLRAAAEATLTRLRSHSRGSVLQQ